METDRDGQTPLHLSILNQGSPDAVSLFASYPEALNRGDNEGRTPAYLAATSKWEDQEEHPCLDLLIDKHHALYRSKQAAMLSDREKHIRALEFILLAGVLGGSAGGYLLGGKNLTTTCDTIYNGFLLQPYLFDVFAVFLFKILQFLFEEAIAPGLDLICFAARRAVSDEGGAGPESKAEEQKGEKEKNLRRGSALVTLGDSYPDRDSIPDAQSHNQDLGITMNPLRSSASSGAGGSARADLEQGTRASLGASRAAAPSSRSALVKHSNIGANVSWTSRVLYSIFAEKIVKAWRKKKYLAAEKTDATYRGADFWCQTPYIFLYSQATMSYVTLVVAVVSMDRSLPAWEQYTNFCATIVNSGIPMTLFSIGKMATLDERKLQMTGGKDGALIFPGLPRMLWVYIGLPLLPIVFPFFTHVMPATALFCWIVVPVTALPFGVYAFFWTYFNRSKLWLFCGARKAFQVYHVSLILELLSRFIFIFLFHVLFNWASLVYAQGLPLTPQGYIGVLVQDWHLRSQTQCFIAHATESSRGLVTLFSWF